MSSENTRRRLSAMHAARLAAVHRELAPHGVPVDTGWAAYDAPGSWANQASGLGAAGPVSAEALDQLMAFYARHGAAAQVLVMPEQHPSLPAALAERGFIHEDPEDLLVRRVDPPATAVQVPGLRFVRVDPTQPEHVERLIEAQMRGFFEDQTPPASHVAITRRVAQHPRAWMWLAELDGRLAGSAGLELWEDTATCIAGAVLPWARRRGVQQAFFHLRIEQARAAGAAWILVGSTPGGPTARNAERAGFMRLCTQQTWVLRPETP